MERIKEFFRKYKKQILIILALIIILIIILFSVPWEKKEEGPAPTSTIRGEGLTEEPTIIKGQINEENKEISNVSVIARNFVEIYGSYSNQSNYANIELALPLLSARFKADMSSFLKESRAKYVPGLVYEGVTTKALNIFVNNIDEEAGKATVTVKAQKKESFGKQINYSIKYQDMLITLIKENERWLVDSAKWIE